MNHNRNAHYWENRDERKERAYLHTKNMAYVFSDHIEQCVRNTKLYDDTNTFDELNPVLTREVSVVDLDTVSAIFRYKRKEKRTAILNFASYKNAGGMFLQGSSAQEESLCHASFLYNVLSEFKDYYAWNEVAQIFKRLLIEEFWTFEKIIFAIPDCSRNKNYKKFLDVMSDTIM